MKLETFELMTCLLTGEVVMIPMGPKMVDVADDNTEDWEDVMDRGTYWWED